MIIYLVCEHVYSEEKWVSSLLLVPIHPIIPSPCRVAQLIHSVYYRILFKRPTAAGHQQKVSTVTVKLEGKIRRAAARTASSRAPRQRSHFILVDVRRTCFFYYFLFFKMQAVLLLFQRKCAHFVLSIWFVLLLGTQLYFRVQMPQVCIFFLLPFHFGLEVLICTLFL